MGSRRVGALYVEGWGFVFMPNCGIAANCALLSEINSQKFYTSARKGQRGVEYGEVEAGRVDGGGQHAEALSEEAAGAIGRPGDGVGVEGGGLGHGGADKQLLHKADGSVGGGGGGRRRNEKHHVQQRVIDPELEGQHAEALSEEAAGAIGRPGDGVGVEGG